MTDRYRLVLLAYPRSYRHDHGSEIASTAVELSAGRWSYRQAGSLLGGGLRARARLATGSSIAGAWASGARTALFALVVIPAGFGLASVFDSSSADVHYTQPAALRLMPVIAVCAAVFTTRWPTAALVSVMWGSAVFTAGFQSTPWAVWYFAPVIAVAWWLALRTDGRRAAHPAVAAVWLGALVLVGPSVGTIIVAAALIMALPLIALALAPFDPRPATAAVILWAILIVQFAPAVWANDAVGPDRWAPLIIPPVGLAVGTAIARFSAHRHIQT